MTSESILEPAPKGMGYRLWCISTQHMAFRDQKELSAYRESIGMSAYPPKKVWQCRICGYWHYDGRTPNPSGDSSGTGRSSK